MQWFSLIVFYLVIAIILTTSVEGKGGRGGGGGRSSSRGSSSSRSSGSSRSWFSSSSSSKSGSGSSKSYGGSTSFGDGGSYGGSKSYGGGGSWNSYGGGKTGGSGGDSGWFRRVFHSRPSGIRYIPIYRRHSYHTHQSSPESETYSYGGEAYNNEPDAVESTTDSKGILAGYSIGKVISSDFYSLFNILSDISKYTDDRKKYDAETTTTESIAETTTEKIYSNADVEITTEKNFPFSEFPNLQTSTENALQTERPWWEQFHSNSDVEKTTEQTFSLPQFPIFSTSSEDPFNISWMDDYKKELSKLEINYQQLFNKDS